MSFSFRSIDFDISELSAFSIPKRVTENELNLYKKIIANYKALSAIPDSLKGPTFVAIDVTYKCNLRCPYCYVNCPDAKAPYMLTEEEWRNVFSDLAKMGTLGICLCGGEPLLREDFFSLVKFAKNSGIRRVNTVSNGTLIDSEMAKKLKEAKLDIVQISIDGASSDIHDRLRGRGSFEKSKKAIEYLVKEEVLVAMSFCCTKYNAEDFPNTIRLAEKLGVKSVRSMFFIPMGGGEKENIGLTEKEYEVFGNKVKNFMEKEKIKDIKVEFGDPSQHIKILPALPNLTFSITSDGWVLPSMYLPYAFSNVRKDSLVNLWRNGLNKIWQNPKFLDLIKNINSEHDFSKHNRAIDGRYIDLIE